MKKLKLFALAAMALIGFSGIAIAADATMLMQDDFVGISFWVITPQWPSRLRTSASYTRLQFWLFAP